MLSISTCLFPGRFEATVRFSLDQRFSIGFKSGLFPSHDNSYTLLSANHFLLTVVLQCVMELHPAEIWSPDPNN